MNSCVICLKDIKSKAPILPCKHTFHSRCISGWLKHESTCPSCKCDVKRYTVGDKVIDVKTVKQKNEGSIDLLDYSVAYIAGLQVTEENDILYKLVWDPKTVKEGDKAWSWEEIESLDIGGFKGPKVLEFHERFNIPLVNPDGWNAPFYFEHEIPVEAGTDPETKKQIFMCPYDGCNHMCWGKRMNMVYHIRNKHVEMNRYKCLKCVGRTYGTLSDFRKHVRRVHNKKRCVDAKETVEEQNKKLKQ